MELQSGQNIELNQRVLRIAVVYPKTATCLSEIDISAFMLSANNKVRGDSDFIFFNQPSTPNDSINLSSSAEGSFFTLDLNLIDSDIAKIAITLVIDGADSVSGLQRIQLSVEGVATFEVPSLAERTEKALILGEVYRHHDGWKFRALGLGFNGGLEPLAKNYGVEVSSPAAMSVAVEPMVNLEKHILAKAPRLISLAKNARVSLVKHSLDAVKAKVAFVLDASGSMKREFKQGHVQAVLDRIAILAVQFDDDGAMDVWGFADKHRKYDDVTLANLDGYIERLQGTGLRVQRELLPELGGINNEPPCMMAIIDYFQNSELPVYVVFITDGGISKTKAIKDAIRRSANHAIFWKFIGLGGNNYGILEQLDTFTDRRIDNTHFFPIDDFAKIDDATLYDMLLKEFSDWKQDAMKKGIIA
ncbi:vWA domain-containing protein [Dickeya lacustris]|uniref:VWA domain-containing protein n=1 Tax=Dickeya lacustris TaxID=2259638 RepID=A0ABY8G5H1_9GAMM|nr:VWA domain-containing protein [Dickeya lacustris]WFN55189.1 VWA domain-containing protein [Dickeya lacustris]